MPPEQGGGTNSSNGAGALSEGGDESGGSASGSAESSSTFGIRSATTTGRGGGGRGAGGRGYRSRGGGRGGRGRGGGRGGGGRGRGGGGGISSGEVTGGGVISASTMMMSEGMSRMEQSIASGETSAVDIANAAAAQMQVTYGSRIIPRGGLCVHKPPRKRSSSVDVAATTFQNDGCATNASSHPSHVTLDDLDDFLIFSRNIFLQTPRPNGEISIDDIWDNATAKKFEVKVPQGSEIYDKAGSKGRGNKRKAVDNAMDDDSSLAGIAVEDVGNSDLSDCQLPTPGNAKLAQDPDVSSKEQLPLCGMEDDEQALAYLYANHHGDSQRAKFSTMVDYDRGYGMSALYCIL